MQLGLSRDALQMVGEEEKLPHIANNDKGEPCNASELGVYAVPGRVRGGGGAMVDAEESGEGGLGMRWVMIRCVFGGYSGRAVSRPQTESHVLYFIGRCPSKYLRKP